MDPFASSKSIQNSLPEDVSISDRTIRKILLDEGYRSYKAKKKPHLKKCHIRDRIRFYDLFKNYGFEDFSKIIWSDESRICLNYGDHPPLVRRPPNSSLDEKYLRPSSKYQISIMVWGWFSAFVLGPLQIIDGTVNNQRYIDILENNLIPYINNKCGGQQILFQDDNASCHRHRNVKNWMQEKGINRIFWPAQSPDLNPIENLWSFLKMKINKYSPNSKKELIMVAKRVWENEIPTELIKNLVLSMEKRLIALKNAKGKHIDY